MKIGLVRHYAVKQPFLKGLAKQSEVLDWFKEYDNSRDLDIVPVEITGDWEVCYSSMLPRAIITAEILYNNNIKKIKAFNEPGISPIFTKNVCLPFLIWGMLFRTAILTNHKSQLENKKVLEQRVQIELDRILTNGNKKILIVSHAIIMGIIASYLFKQNFVGPSIRSAVHAKLYTFER